MDHTLNKLMERSWLYVGGCKQIPTSVLVCDGAASVAVLSNGSGFVHLLQIEDNVKNVRKIS